MLKKKRYLYLNSEEFSILMKSLVRLKNSLIQQARPTDCVDELIVKILESPIKKMSA